MVLDGANLSAFILEYIMPFLLIILLFHAVNILATFRKGLLERGWKFLSMSIIILELC
jgi:hypothetical protein